MPRQQGRLLWRKEVTDYVREITEETFGKQQKEAGDALITDKIWIMYFYKTLVSGGSMKDNGIMWREMFQVT